MPNAEEPQTIPPYFCDVQMILKEFVTSTGDEHPAYSTFVKIWDKINVSYIHRSNPQVQAPDDFLQFVYQAVILFIKHPYAALASSNIEVFAEAIKKQTGGSRTESAVKSGCVFLLYGLFMTQPERREQKVSIRLTLETEKILRELRSMTGDVEKAFSSLVREGGFQIVAGPRHGPAAAPAVLKKDKRERDKLWGPSGFKYIDRKNKRGASRHLNP